jgi:hypothetical protein
MKPKSLVWVITISIFSGVFLGIFLERIFVGEGIFWGARGPLHHAEKSEGKASESQNVGIPEQVIGKLSLFILAGQSNMVGYGEIHPTDIQIDPKVLVFGNDYHWKYAREPLDDPTGQVDMVSLDVDAGYSCGTAFAKTLLRKNPNWFVGLIPCAKSGSSIEEWQRNLSDSTLYGSCLKRSLAASPMGRIRGFLFFQGETDALDPGLEPQKIRSPFQWEEKFKKFVKDIRNDLQIYDLPIVFAQIGVNKNSKEFKNWKIVQEQQSQVRLPNCKMIKTDDLSLKDEVHFDNKSYRIIGERFALAMVEIR